MNDSWFVFSNGQQLGPYTGEQLVQFAQAGNINAETLVWAEGMADWLPAAQIQGLIATPAPAPAQAPPVARAAAAGPPMRGGAPGAAPRAAAPGPAQVAPVQMAASPAPAQVAPVQMAAAPGPPMRGSAPGAPPRAAAPGPAQMVASAAPVQMAPAQMAAAPAHAQMVVAPGAASRAAAPGPAPRVGATGPVTSGPAQMTASGSRTGTPVQTATAGHAGLVRAYPPGGPYPYFYVKPVNFGMWLGIFIGAMVCMLIMVFCFTTAAVSAAQAASATATEETKVIAESNSKSRLMIGMVMASLSMLGSVLAAVFLYINLYRAWYCLRAGGPRTTPGKAIGMLFVPFFNLYWIFVAIAGLPKDWNRIMSSYDGLQSAPRMSEGMFLTLCIGSLAFPPLALVMIFPVMSQICKGVNYFSMRRDPNRVGAIASPGALRPR